MLAAIKHTGRVTSWCDESEMDNII